MLSEKLRSFEINHESELDSLHGSAYRRREDLGIIPFFGDLTEQGGNQMHIEIVRAHNEKVYTILTAHGRVIVLKGNGILNSRCERKSIRERRKSIAIEVFYIARRRKVKRNPMLTFLT